MSTSPSRRRFLQLSGATAALAATPAVLGRGSAQALPHPSPRAHPGPLPDLNALPAGLRPKFRWWWNAPCATSEFAEEVRAFAEAGFGSAEIAFSPEGWATQDQRASLRTSLEQAHRHGVALDMTLGAAWPVTTPNTSKNRLAQQELVYGRTEVAGGGRFSGPAPAPLDDPDRAGAATLVAVTAARVRTASPAVSELGTPPDASTVLEPGTLVDLSDRITDDGELDWTAPDGPHLLFAFWQRNTEQDVSDVLSAETVAAVTDFLEREQIGDDNLALLREAGGEFFEDSLEYETVNFWTWRMLEEFERRRGYDLRRYLPLLFVQGRDRYWVPDPLPRPDFDLPGDGGERIRRDFYRTLTDLYVANHLRPLQQWAEKLGMRFRSQVAFGNTFDATRSARELARMGGIADDETLNAGDARPTSDDNSAFTLDHYRALAGGSHQGGQNQLNLETGAELLRANEEWLHDYKAFVDKAWAGGITRPVIHGYGHQTATAAWPGWDRFNAVISESWNHRTFPQWKMWRPLADYWTRGCLLLESGRPRVDVAVYRDGFITTAARANWQDFVFGDAAESDLEQVSKPAPFFDSTELEHAGYTLEYLDPVGLFEPHAQGRGVLYPEGPAYRALVVDERMLPAEAAEVLAKQARKGLAVVFVGDLPERGTSYTDAEREDRRVRQAVSQILASGRARRVARPQDTPEALRSLGVRPAAEWQRPVPVHTQRRQIDGAEVFYLWNSAAEPETFTASFATAGGPSTVDLWTGHVAPCPQYVQSEGRTQLDLTMEPGETLVLVFHGEPMLHAVAGNANLFAGPRGLEARESTPGARRVVLSDGSVHTFTVPALPDPITPASWSLHVAEASPDGPVAHERSLRALDDWRNIHGLELVSGTGTYTAAIDVPSTWLARDRGVRLTLVTAHGPVQAHLNGQRISPSILPTQVDITDLLRPGRNQLVIETTTTLKNEIVRIARETNAPNLSFYAKYPDTQPYGLIGPVRIEPYARTSVTKDSR